MAGQARIGHRLLKLKRRADRAISSITPDAHSSRNAQRRHTRFSGMWCCIDLRRLGVLFGRTRPLAFASHPLIPTPAATRQKRCAFALA